MAIWQFDVHFILPQQTPASQVIQSAQISWNAERLKMRIGEILPPAPSWAENLLIWGEENGDRIHAVAKNDQIIELTARMDLRNPNRKFAEDLLRLALDLGAPLEARTGQVIPPDLRSFAQAMRQSDSFRFVMDPEAFFRTQSPALE